jgi:hypothetical protein
MVSKNIVHALIYLHSVSLAEVFLEKLELNKKQIITLWTASEHDMS